MCVRGYPVVAATGLRAVRGAPTKGATLLSLALLRVLPPAATDLCSCSPDSACLLVAHSARRLPVSVLLAALQGSAGSGGNHSGT